MTYFRRVVLIVCILLGTACNSDHPKLLPLTDDATVLAFGDSLTYGTGADHATESYPATLAKLTGLNVINAGIPGEISREGLERIDTLLTEYSPELVILCHGGNDLLRKLDKDTLTHNLSEIIARVQNSGAQIILLAVPSPGVFLSVDPLYQALAQQHKLVWSENIIADVEMKTVLKSDAIHPNAKGYAVIAEEIKTLLIKSGALASN